MVVRAALLLAMAAAAEAMAGGPPRCHYTLTCGQNCHGSGAKNLCVHPVGPGEYCTAVCDDDYEAMTPWRYDDQPNVYECNCDTKRDGYCVWDNHQGHNLGCAKFCSEFALADHATKCPKTAPKNYGGQPCRGAARPATLPRATRNTPAATRASGAAAA